MAAPQFIDEPVLVQARLLSDGAMRPDAFVWRGRAYAIADWGRQWDETSEGTRWRCYLVRAADGETFELRCAPEAGRWLLHRAWPRAPRAA